MLTRLYLMAGSVLVFGYGVSSLAGWEFGKAVVVTPAPPRYAAIAAGSGWGGRSSTYYGSSSTYRGSSIPSGPTGGK